MPTADPYFTGFQLPHSNVESVVDLILQRFPGLQVTSTISGTHAQDSYHYRGEAVDISGPAPTMNAAAQWINSSGLWRYLVEGIHNPGLSVKNEQQVPDTFWGSGTWSEHANHLHIAVLDNTTIPVSAFSGSASRTPIRPRSQSVPSYVPGQYRQWVAQAAAGTGIPATVVAAQINTESGFNPRVTSPTGAGGIAQFEPGTWDSLGIGGTPYNPSDALRGYTKYMGDLLKQYNGNIRDALAAYNAGSGNLQAGYGYADSILQRAGLGDTALAGRGGTGITRPGGTAVGQNDDQITPALDAYDQLINMPRATPNFSSLGPAAPFKVWYQSFLGKWGSVDGS